MHKITLYPKHEVRKEEENEKYLKKEKSQTAFSRLQTSYGLDSELTPRLCGDIIPATADLNHD